MGLFTKHQYTDVTSIINDCCKSHDSLDEDGDYMQYRIRALLDAIKSQRDYVEPGPVEAARALRKKLKYGSIDEQYNGLLLLDLLVFTTCDSKYMAAFFADDKIIDRMIFFFTGGEGQPEYTYDSSSVDPSLSKPKKKIVNLALSIGAGWYEKYQDSPNMTKLLDAYSSAIEKAERKKPLKERQRVPDFMNDDADMEYIFESDGETRPKTNAELDKKFKIPKINYEKEAPKILQLIAEANILSTNLMNTLNTLSKDELSIHSIKANEGFDECRSIRRKVLRYLQLVQREELLGPLLKCNDDLVAALKKYESKSVPYGFLINNSDEDSDEDSLANYESDDESAVDRRYVSRSDINPPCSALSQEASTSSVNINKKAPPPVPAKNSVLKPVQPITDAYIGTESTNVSKSREQALIDEYDPFSDMNEVTPAKWS